VVVRVWACVPAGRRRARWGGAGPRVFGRWGV